MKHKTLTAAIAVIAVSGGAGAASLPLCEALRSTSLHRKLEAPNTSILCIDGANR